MSARHGVLLLDSGSAFNCLSACALVWALSLSRACLSPSVVNRGQEEREALRCQLREGRYKMVPGA
jgi:hypothetical protein